MPRSYVSSYGPDPAAVRAGLAWLKEIGRPALVAVPQKSNLERTIEGVIGVDAVKALSRGETVRFGTVPLSLATERQHPRSWQGAVLAIYPTRKLLDGLDALRVENMLVVPWIEDEIRFWIDTWSATQVQVAGAIAPPTVSVPTSPSSLDPVVEAALRELTESVNLSSGLGHPNDRSSAIEALTILRDAGLPFTPEGVRAWLVAQGHWQPTHANDVESVCTDVLAGKRLRYERGRWPGALARWQSAVRGTSR